MTTPVAMNAFQASCLEKAMRVLETHGIQGSTPRALQRDLDYIVVDFRHRDQLFRIEIYENDVVMMQGKGLFECYQRQEHASEASLVESFAKRLNRYLSAGKWDEDR